MEELSGLVAELQVIALRLLVKEGSFSLFKKQGALPHQGNPSLKTLVLQMVIVKNLGLFKLIFSV